LLNVVHLMEELIFFNALKEAVLFYIEICSIVDYDCLHYLECFATSYPVYKTKQTGLRYVQTFYTHKKLYLKHDGSGATDT
jgi:hypothetical protein